jgi:hypothetical protein
MGYIPACVGLRSANPTYVLVLFGPDSAFNLGEILN